MILSHLPFPKTTLHVLEIVVAHVALCNRYPGGGDEYGGMRVASHNCSGAVRELVHVRVEQVWAIGPRRLRRSSRAGSCSSIERQEDRSCTSFDLFFSYSITICHYFLSIIKCPLELFNKISNCFVVVVVVVASLSLSLRSPEDGGILSHWTRMDVFTVGVGTRSAVPSIFPSIE